MAQHKRLGDLLLEKKLLSQRDLDRALLEHQRWGGPLGGYLVAMGMIREHVLVQVIAEQLGLPFVDLDEEPIDARVAQLLPREVCDRFNLIAFRLDTQRRHVDIAMSDPLSVEAASALRRITRVTIRPFIAGPRAVSRAINRIFFSELPVDAVPPAPAPLPQTPPDSLLSVSAPDVAAALRPVVAGVDVAAMAPPTGPAGGLSGLEGGTAELVAERLHRLEVGLRRAERTIQALVALLAERGQIGYAEIAQRVGTLQSEVPEAPDQGG